MAIGLRRVAMERFPRWEGTPVLGCDGLPEGGQRHVTEGILRATVVKPVTAGRAVELAAAALQGGGAHSSEVLAPRSHPPLPSLAREAP
jgi:hypothetical protein